MIYGIIRVSTVEQIAGQSLMEQRRVITGIAMQLGTEEPKIFSDEGVSGSVPLAARAGGKKLMAAVKAGDTIVAAKLDRMFRSSIDALQTVKRLKELKVKLYIPDCGGFVTENGASEMFLSIMAAVAQFERTRIEERATEGRKAKRAIGGHIGGEAPYGYCKIGTGKEARLEPNPAEQVVVDKAGAMKREGRPARWIAAELNRQNYRSRVGNPFQATQVVRMLKTASQDLFS